MQLVSSFPFLVHILSHKWSVFCVSSQEWQTWLGSQLCIPACIVLSAQDSTGMLQHSKRTFPSLFTLCSEEENSGQTDRQMDTQPHEYCPAAYPNYKRFSTVVHFSNTISLQQHYWPTNACLPNSWGRVPDPRCLRTPRRGCSAFRGVPAQDQLLCVGAGGRRVQSALRCKDPVSLAAWLSLAAQLIQANGNSECLLFLSPVLDFFPELTSKKNAYQKSRRNSPQNIERGFWGAA